MAKKKTSLKASTRAKGQLRVDQQRAARRASLRKQAGGASLTEKEGKALERKAAKPKAKPKAKARKRGGVFGIADKLRQRGKL